MNKILLFISFLFYSTTFLTAQDATTLVKTGDPIPAFTFETAKGNQVSISDYKGKVIWINFFATWCPPCGAELPVLQKEVWEKYNNNPHFALLIFGREEGWQKVTDFKNANKFTFPMLPDEKREVFKLFATQSIPRNIIVNKEGVIVYQSIGFSPEEFKKAEAILDKLLQ
jgi:peroxiredoxin